MRGNQYVWAGPGPVTAAALAASLPKRSWHAITIAAGSKGPRRYAWAWAEINHDLGPKWRRWLLIRKGLDDREELAYYRIWQEHLEGVRPERTVTRFATA